MKWNGFQTWTAFIFAAALFSFAQPADYFSAQSIEEIPEAKVGLSYEFLYRVQLETGMRFYKIRMTDGLYRSKNAFVWPENIKAAERTKLPVFGSSEILFNDRLILADVAALFYKADTGLVALEPITPPGIVIVRANTEAVYQDIDRHGIQPERPFPTALYTFNDTTKVCLVRAPGFLPKEYDPFTPARSYRVDQVDLDSFPRYSLLPHFLNDGMENASSDSSSMAALDRKIAELESNLKNDSLLVSEYQAGLRNNYPQAMPLRSYEDSTDYISRVRVRDVEALGISYAAYNLMGFNKALIPLRERIFQLKEVRKVLAKEAAFEREPRTAFLRKNNWNRIFLSVQNTLGRNLPSWTVNPGPTDLWGIGGRIQYNHRFVHRLSWSLHAAGGQVFWKYNDLLSKQSSEFWAGGGAGFQIPLLILPRVITWQVELGGIAIYRNTDVFNGQKEDQRWGTSPGFYAGTSFLVSPLPIQIDVRYQYTLDGFGDLQIGLGFPIPFIGGTP